MKNKLAVGLSLLLMGVGACTLVACGDDSGKNDGATVSGEVSDAVWQETLSLNFESAESCTCVLSEKSTFDKSQAQEYGEYYDYTSTVKIDTVNQIIYCNDVDYCYDDVDEEIYVDYYQSYEFYHGGKYYRVSYHDDTDEYPDETPEWSCHEITKADFISEMESYGNAFATLNLYSDPMMKDYLFNYNSETKAYEMDASFGTSGYSLKFTDNGVSFNIQVNSLMVITESFYDVNKTVVSVPTNILQIVAEYEAEKAEVAE